MQLLRVTEITNILQVPRSEIRNKVQAGAYKDVVVVNDRLKLIPLESVIEEVKTTIEKKESSIKKLKKGLEKLQKKGEKK